MLLLRIRIWIRSIRKFLGIPETDPSIIKQKKLGKPWFLLFCDFFMTLSLKTDVNVPSKSTKQKTRKKLFFVGILKATEHWLKEQDPDLALDPDT